MAEEGEDDESFGDFTFASFPNQPFPSSTSNSKSNHTNPVDDDDWGDFVNHSNQINGGFSKPFEPFRDHAEKNVNGHNGIAVKPQGAIPLSIFGEEEEEEEEEEQKEPASAFVFSKSDPVKKGFGTNGSVGITDLISNLYNQRPRISSDNGSISISNVAAPNPNADGPMNSNASNLYSDSEDDNGWEFKSAEWETGIKSQNNNKVMDQIF